MLKRIPYRNKKIINAAKGEECMLSSPWCNHNPKTTVFCHVNESYAGKGMEQKADDFFGFFGCSSCHDVYDGRKSITNNWNEKEDWYQQKEWHVLRAIYRTQRRLFDLGIIK